MGSILLIYTHNIQDKERGTSEMQETTREETKQEKFIRLAEGRTNAIIDRIRVLTNLSDKRFYKYSDKEVSEMFCAIEREVKKAKLAFTKSRTNTKPFSFSSNREKGVDVK